MNVKNRIGLLYLPGALPCFEDSGRQAIDAVEKYIDLDLLTKVATPPKLTNVDYGMIVEKFKKLIVDYSLTDFEGAS